MKFSSISPVPASSALRAGAQGVQTGMASLAKTGSDIARLNGPVPDAQGQVPNLATAAVEQVTAKHLVQSNARTIEVASETIGTLLDVKA